MSDGTSPAEAERLALLVEKCGQFLDVVGMVESHGYDARNEWGETNREALQRCMGKSRAVVDLMMRAGDLSAAAVAAAHGDKMWLMRLSTRHQGELL